MNLYRHVLLGTIGRWDGMWHAYSPACALHTGHEEGTDVLISIDLNATQTRHACILQTRVLDQAPTDQTKALLLHHELYLDVVSRVWKEMDAMCWVQYHPLLLNDQAVVLRQGETGQYLYCCY